MSYLKEVQDIVQGLLNEHVAKIVEEYLEDFKAEESADHYDESYIHESLGAGEYDLKESAEILEELSEHEADDDGLWEGKDPKKAIAAMAFYTMRNAAEAEFRNAVAEINGLDFMEDDYNYYHQLEEDGVEGEELETKQKNIRDEMVRKLTEYIDTELF